MKIDGILFSWWEQFDEHQELERKISEKIELPFKFYFTEKIIDDCRKYKYSWYKDIINEQKMNIDQFFRQLLGEE